MSIDGDITTPAVLLRTRPLGEADLIVVLYSPILGKVHAAARNARRSRRRFPGGLTGGACGRATLSRGRGNLARLNGFVSTSDISLLGQNLERFASVAYVCELTDQLVLENEPDPRLFAHVFGAIREVVLGSPWVMVLRRFELGLLECLGLLPTFDRCCVCGVSLNLTAEFVAFDDLRGGGLCPAHAREGEPVASAALVLATELSKTPWSKDSNLEAYATWPPGLSSPTPSPAIRRDLRDLAFHPLRRHLTRPLRSLAFFSQLSGHAGAGE